MCDTRKLSLELRVDDEALLVERMSFDHDQEPAQDNGLLAQHSWRLCDRCQRRIVTGQSIRRRATGGWQHEEC